MTQHHLSPAALAILLHLDTHRRATTRELITAQQALADGRTESSQQMLPYNLMRLGYVEQVTTTRPVQWRITDCGRRALDAQSPQQRKRSAIEPAQRTTFTYAGRQIAAPNGPRWAFDFAPDTINHRQP